MPPTLLDQCPKLPLTLETKGAVADSYERIILIPHFHSCKTFLRFSALRERGEKQSLKQNNIWNNFVEVFAKHKTHTHNTIKWFTVKFTKHHHNPVLEYFYSIIPIRSLCDFLLILTPGKFASEFNCKTWLY